MEDMKALQAKEIEILQVVHDACEKLGIEYVIMYGTLIGAVRHHGFIPWDDDIDICMTQENYDVFIKEGNNYLPENIRIQHVLTEDECPNLFAKVRDKSTTFLHREHIALNINQGVFIDVFPVGKIKAGRVAITIEYYRRKIFNIINECFDLAYIAGIKRKGGRIMGLFIHYIIVRGLLHKIHRKDFILKEEERRRDLHRHGDDITFVSVYEKVLGQYTLFTKRRLYEFDGYNFYGPEDYNKLLSLLYGNYMNIPPVEEQVTHKPLFVDLGMGYSAEEVLEILKQEKQRGEQGNAGNDFSGGNGKAVEGADPE